MGKVKRSQVKTFVNTGTPSVPVWSLIGEGVSSAKIAMNPKTTEETYIHQDSATISVEGYAPTLPIEQIAVNGSALFEYLDALRKGRDVLDAVETEIVNVWLYKTNAIGYYLAEKQNVSIQMDDVGGDGGASTKIAYTINYIGDPSPGFFNPADLEFFDAPVDATLTSLSVGGHALTPVFSSGWLYYSLAVSSDTDTITVVADSGSAVIAIDVDDTPVNNGEDATWSEGDNLLTVEVTVGAEVVEYLVLVTYTAP